MNNSSSPIITDNHLRITKKYFDDIILPIVYSFSKSIKPITKKYTIAGKTICINFYSEILFEKMHKALSHNEEGFVSTPDLTVNIWDSVSTKTSIIPPWKNKLEYLYNDDISSKISKEDSIIGIYLYNEGTLNIYNEEEKTAYFWIEDADTIPYWLTAAPIRPILNWFLSGQGIHLVHGALVGINGNSVLLTAKGGSGKSTTALSCLLSGMEYLGDDYITIKSGDIITTHSLFNSVKITQNSLDVFPELKENISNVENIGSDKEKAIIFLSELFPNQIVKESQLKAIMIPVIKNIEETRIIPASKIQAMLAMIPTTIFQLSLTESNKIIELKSIIEKTPCYFLEMNSDIRQIPQVIKSFILYE